MKKESEAIIYSLSDLIRYLASPFAWLDRYNLENPGRSRLIRKPRRKLFSHAGHEQEQESCIQRQSGSDHSCFVIFPVCPPPCLPRLL
jgi:hypothetical protein